MNSRNVVLLVVVLLTLVAAGVIFVLPKVEVARAPQPRAAWVAIEVEGTSVGVVGEVRTAAGRPFRLHAVLEAEDDGETVYLTSAPGLRIDGRDVPEESLRAWKLPRVLKVLWFTVEGPAPYLQVDSPERLDRFSYQEYLHPEWGTSQSIEGRIDSHFDDQLDVQQGARDFGTQRYQVWIELMAEEKSAIAEERFKSPGPADLAVDDEASSRRLATLIAELPDPAAPASRRFGLPQLEPSEDATDQRAIQARISELDARGLAFSRVLLLRETLELADSDYGSLPWKLVDLRAGVPWTDGEGVSPGDLLAIGARFVVLYRDVGRPGELDPADLSFDFDTGATVRPISDVFTDAGGDVQWADLDADLENG